MRAHLTDPATNAAALLSGFSARATRGLMQEAPATVTQLVDRLLAAETLVDSFEAGRELFGAAGVGLGSDAAPATSDPGSASPPLLAEEILALARQVQTSTCLGLVSLGEFAAHLTSLGYPFRTDPGQPAAHVQLMVMLRDWYTAAVTDAEDGAIWPDLATQIDRFIILTVAELMRRRIPTLNLDQINLAEAPDTYGLSHLELVLLTGVADWAGADLREPAPLASHEGAADQVALHGPRRPLEPPPGAIQLLGTDPCSELLSKLGPWKGPATVAAKQVKGILGPIIEHSGEGGADAAKAVSKTLSSFGLANRIYRIAVMATSLQCTAKPLTTGTPHKPAPDEADVKPTLRATIQIPNDQWSAFQDDLAQYGSAEKIRDCLKTAGFPVPDDLNSVAGDLSKWQIEWLPLTTFDKHAQINLADNTFTTAGSFTCAVQPLGDHAGYADLTIQLLPEKVDHHHGKLRSAKISVQANAIPPRRVTIGTYISGAKAGIGLISGIVDIVTGWTGEVFPRHATATLPIDYHAPGRKIRLDTDYRGTCKELTTDGTYEMNILDHITADIEEQEDGSYQGDVTVDVLQGSFDIDGGSAGSLHLSNEGTYTGVLHATPWEGRDGAEWGISDPDYAGLNYSESESGVFQGVEYGRDWANQWVSVQLEWLTTFFLGDDEDFRIDQFDSHQDQMQFTGRSSLTDVTPADRAE